MKNIVTRWIWAIIFAALACLVLSWLFGGFILYQWVLACEAMAASLALLAFYVRYYRHDPRESKWPPLLPLAVIAAAGGAKSFYVATGADTPIIVVALLLWAVGWFFVSSWRIWKAERRATG